MKTLIFKVLKKIIKVNSVVDLLIDAAFEILKGYLNTKDFSKKAKGFTIGVYSLAKAWGTQLVIDTSTNLDNDSLNEFLELCKAVADKQGFKLPEIEEL